MKSKITVTRKTTAEDLCKRKDAEGQHLVKARRRNKNGKMQRVCVKRQIAFTSSRDVACNEREIREKMDRDRNLRSLLSLLSLILLK